ncbi:hypothetical protein SAMN05192554_11312 [Haloarchaeobius iranensis]|uniref:PGF-CTERM protein n=2 Tax=Haloarchaeobius iranensis TaxID=996166 RepID=A0A1G9Y5D5_9EURY|nr:hypothetical protein SAMN05192554_11312 [Haloarchaeobius iranensis]
MVTEGSAEYLAALETYQQGRISFTTFHDAVESESDQSVVLAEPRTWNEYSDYRKGSRVAAALDARIRQETGGNYTLRDVIYVLNREAGKYASMLTHEDLKAAVERVVGRPMDDWLDRYVTTSEVPSVPEDPGLFSQPSGEPDGDGDGIANIVEQQRNVSSPFLADTDGDGLDDGSEFANGSDPTATDTDGDGLGDAAEVRVHGTNPNATDTDGDGFSDSAELDRYETDPTAADTDDDGVSDETEVIEHGSDPTVEDSDGDGLDDGVEIDQHSTDPTTVDTDGDGLDDGVEVTEHDTDPTLIDTDGDGLTDGEEVNEFETDPNTENDEEEVRATPTATLTPTSSTTQTPTETVTGTDSETPGFGVPAAFTALGCLVAARRYAGQ